MPKARFRMAFAGILALAAGLLSCSLRESEIPTVITDPEGLTATTSATERPHYYRIDLVWPIDREPGAHSDRKVVLVRNNPGFNLDAAEAESRIPIPLSDGKYSETISTPGRYRYHLEDPEAPISKWTKMEATASVPHDGVVGDGLTDRALDYGRLYLPAGRWEVPPDLKHLRAFQVITPPAGTVIVVPLPTERAKRESPQFILEAEEISGKITLSARLHEGAAETPFFIPEWDSSRATIHVAVTEPAGYELNYDFPPVIVGQPGWAYLQRGGVGTILPRFHTSPSLPGIYQVVSPGEEPRIAGSRWIHIDHHGRLVGLRPSGKGVEDTRFYSLASVADIFENGDRLQLKGIPYIAPREENQPPAPLEHLDLALRRLPADDPSLPAGIRTFIQIEALLVKHLLPLRRVGMGFQYVCDDRELNTELGNLELFLYLLEHGLPTRSRWNEPPFNDLGGIINLGTNTKAFVGERNVITPLRTFNPHAAAREIFELHQRHQAVPGLF